MVQNEILCQKRRQQFLNVAKIHAKFRLKPFVQPSFFTSEKNALPNLQAIFGEISGYAFCLVMICFLNVYVFLVFFLDIWDHLEFITKVEREERGHLPPSPVPWKSTKRTCFKFRDFKPQNVGKETPFFLSSLLNRVSRSIHVPEPLKSCGASVAKGRLRVHSVHSIGSSTLKTWRKSRWAEWYGWWTKSCTTWDAPKDLDSGGKLGKPWKNNIWGHLKWFLGFSHQQYVLEVSGKLPSQFGPPMSPEGFFANPTWICSNKNWSDAHESSCKCTRGGTFKLRMVEMILIQDTC